MKIVKFSTHYEINEHGRPIEVSINVSELALECTHCDSFDCRHVKLIWNEEWDKNYLEKLGFLNPLKYRN